MGSKEAQTLEVSFLGGLHWWKASLGLVASVDKPLVRLQLHQGGMFIGPASKIAQWVTFGQIPTFEIATESIILARRVKKGVRLQVEHMEKPLVFVYRDAERILNLLASKNVPIDTTLHEPHSWEETVL